MTSRVSMVGITKHFDAVKALQGASLELHAGEIHTLAGENGSGKSTLLKILAGVIRPDDGTIAIDGSEVTFGKVRDAISHGISMVSQELSLVPHLSIAENVFLGHNQTRGTLGIDWRDTEKRAVDVLKRLNLDVDPKDEVSSLPQHEQQLVEIARAMAADSKVLLLDEPTSSLAPNEVAALFKVVRQLRDEGVAIVMISHRMSEMLDISDRFTVLRDSKFIDTSAREGVTEDWLIERMVLNKPKKGIRLDKSSEEPELVLEVKGMTDRASLGSLQVIQSMPSILRRTIFPKRVP